MAFGLNWQRIHVIEDHFLVILGDRVRLELAHTGVVVVLRNERRHWWALAVILHVVEREAVANLLLRVGVRMIHWAV